MFFCFFCCCISCVQQNKKLSETTIVPELLNDSIWIIYPEFLNLRGNYLYLTDLKATDSILQVFDVTNESRIGRFGTMGEGPKEFQMPFMVNGINETVIMYNYGTSYMTQISADFFLKGEVLPDMPSNPLPQSQAMQQISEDRFLYLFPEGKDSIFKLFDRAGTFISSFGKAPLNVSISKDNARNLYQGDLLYDYENEYLLYRSISVPYLALYKRENDTFVLKLEKELSKFTYEQIDDNVKINYLEPCRTKMCTFTKNYIVFLDDSNIKREDLLKFKSPAVTRRQLIVLDYNLDPLKVIDLNMDVHTIASDSRSDVVYFVAENPDFMLMKINL